MVEWEPGFEWDLRDSLAVKLQGFLDEIFRPECEVDQAGYSGDKNIVTIRIYSFDEGWRLSVYLHTFPRVYPSQLPNIVRNLRERTEENVVHLIGAPKLSKESRSYLKDERFPYIDLAGGFFLSLELFNKKFHLEIDRDESYEAERWTKRIASGLPGFSPGRVALYRTLLVNPGKEWGVRELARATEMDPGTTSRYLKETVNAGWVERRGRSEHVLEEPSELLNYWAGIAKRIRRKVGRYYLIAKSYDETREIIAAGIVKDPDTYHTLWSGAEFYGHFQEQPFVGIYCSDPMDMRKRFARFIPGPSRAGNLWLLHAPDKAIGLGAIEKDGERAVCWQQVYVDLMNAPHRGKSIAAMLRKEMEGFDHF